MYNPNKNLKIGNTKMLYSHICFPKLQISIQIGIRQYKHSNETISLVYKLYL